MAHYTPLTKLLLLTLVAALVLAEAVHAADEKQFSCDHIDSSNTEQLQACIRNANESTADSHMYAAPADSDLESPFLSFPNVADIIDQADFMWQEELAYKRRVLQEDVDSINAQLADGPASLPEKVYASMKNYLETLHSVNSSDTLLEAWEKHISLERDDPVGMDAGFPVDVLKPFTCPNIKHRSDERPTSVHKLRPGDIDVVAALGDSLTAGFGAGAKPYLLWQYNDEYRGRSFSAGGDMSHAEGVTTLPNILRTFNPNLKGYSHGILKLGDEPLTDPRTEMNVAITGAIAHDMPEQARRLVQRLRDDPDVNMEDDWKMATLFIGANNLCDYCLDEIKHSPDAYALKIASALDILRDNVPRLFVNVVEMFDVAPVTKLADFSHGKLICSSLLRVFDACPCGRHDLSDTSSLTTSSRAYQRVLQNMVASGKYDTKEDFTVVNQPFFREIAPPQDRNGDPDMSYFAQDCFHFSNKGHNRAGKALWNSIIEPVGLKRDEWDLDEPTKCPETEFLPTKKNSEN